MKKLLAKFLLKINGWKLDIMIPMEELDKIKKCVLITAPHTSNWDFYYGVVSFAALGIPIKIFIKDAWTKPWYGFVIKGLGGIGINREQSSELVNFAVKTFEKHERLFLITAPEGTRSYVEKWKTGFYHMAKKAEVPIVLSFIDYGRKAGGGGITIHVENKTKEEVFDQIEEFYKTVTPKYPEKYNKKIY